MKSEKSERACIGTEDDIQIPPLLIDDLVMVHDLTRVFQRLIDFLAGVKGQQPVARQFSVGARLDMRNAEAVCLQFGPVYAIGVEQDCFALLRLFDR